MNFFKQIKTGIKVAEIEKTISYLAGHAESLMKGAEQHNGNVRMGQEEQIMFRDHLEKLYLNFRPLKDQALSIPIKVPFPPYQSNMMAAIIGTIAGMAKLGKTYKADLISSEWKAVYLDLNQLVPYTPKYLSFEELIEWEQNF